MKKTTLFFLICATLIEAQTPSDSAAIGEKVSSQLLQTLGSELKAHMITNGPLDAMQFCNDNAQLLTAQVSLSEHFNVKRTTLLARNEGNAANDEEAAILKSWDNQLKNSQTLPPYTIMSDGKTDRFYKPIVINNELCLKCHGVLDQNSELSKEIKKLYPNDKATGYKMGDLRGMFVVEVPLKH